MSNYCRDCKNKGEEGQGDQWYCTFWQTWITLLSSCRTGYIKK